MHVLLLVSALWLAADPAPEQAVSQTAAPLAAPASTAAPAPAGTVAPPAPPPAPSPPAAGSATIDPAQLPPLVPEEIIPPPPDGAPPPEAPIPSPTIEPALPPNIVITSSLGGSTAATGCGRSEETPQLFNLAAELTNWPKSVRLDGGGLLDNSTLGRLTIEHDVKGFAQTLRDLGLSGLALNRGDLGSPRDAFLQAAHAFKNIHLPYVADNLSCDASAKAVCDAVLKVDDPPHLVDSPQGKVAIVAAISPDALAHMAPGRAKGLHLNPPQPALEKAIRAARKAGARWIIAFYDGASGQELEDTLGLAKAMGQGDNAPDVLVGARLASYFSSLTPPSLHSLPVVASHPGHAMLVLPLVQTAPTPDPRAVPPAIRVWSEGITRWICSDYAGTAHQWKMPSGLDGEGVANLVLDIIRDQSHAEVAMVNQHAINTGYIRSVDITLLDIIQALPYDNALMLGHIPGSVLKTLFNADLTAKKLRIRGMKSDGHNGILINGRALDETQTYVVVLNDFLASGGENIITDKTLKFIPAPPATLREAWMHWLARRVDPQDKTAGAPRDPANAIRWVLRGVADASFSSTIINNPSPTDFTDTQLSRVNATAFHGDVEFRADADHPDFTFENDLVGRYGVARTATATGLPAPRQYSETDDLIFARDTLAQKRWSSKLPRWYIPVTFAESYLESEFTRPTTRAYHHLEWRPIAGIRFSLTPDVSISGGAGLDWETLALPGQLPAGQPRAAGVVVGGAQLRPKRIFKYGPFALDAESSLDVSWRDPGNTSTALIRFHAKISLPIWQTLSLTLSYDLFARHLDPAFAPTAIATRGWSFSGDALIGLSFSWLQPLQTYWF